MMSNLKESIEAVKAKRAKELKATADPDNGKTPAELEKEIPENHEAMLESATKAASTKAAIEAKAAKNKFIEHETKPIPDLPEYNVEPVINPNEICSFCGEEFTAQGIGRHVAAKHKAPGITLEDINRMNQGEINPPDLLDEKGITTIYGLSPEIEKKYFSKWVDTEEDLKATGKIEDLGEVKAPEKIDQEKINLDPDNEKKAKKDSKGNWMAGLLTAALLGAYAIVDKNPSLKEKILGKETPGPKESPQSSGKKSYTQHAIDVNKARNNH